jgi:Cu/Ag efflux pump CusA
MPSGTNQISTDISTTENGQNRVYVTSNSRSVDICSVSSQNQAKLPKVAETLGNYVAFDFE